MKVYEDPYCLRILAAIGKEARRCLSMNRSWRRKNKFSFKKLEELSGIQHHGVLSAKLKSLIEHGYLERVKKRKKRPWYRLKLDYVSLALTKAMAESLAAYPPSQVHVTTNGVLCFGIPSTAIGSIHRKELQTLARQYRHLGRRFLEIRNSVHGAIVEAIWSQIADSKLTWSAKWLFFVLVHYHASVASLVVPMIGSRMSMTTFELIDPTQLRRAHRDFESLPAEVRVFVERMEMAKRKEILPMAKKMDIRLFRMIASSPEEALEYIRAAVPEIAEALSHSMLPDSDEATRSRLEQFIGTELHHDLLSASSKRKIQEFIEILGLRFLQWALAPKIVSDPWLGLGMTSSRPPEWRLSLEPPETPTHVGIVRWMDVSLAE